MDFENILKHRRRVFTFQMILDERQSFALQYDEH